jgi:MoxR-like ATPase
VIATENQVGAAGTQKLPHAQMDRFLARLEIGYPDKGSEIRIIQGRQTVDPYAEVRNIVDPDTVKSMQAATLAVTIKDALVEYIVDITAATRNSQQIELGISPRGAIAVSHMAKASALMNNRDYVNEEDIRDVFCDVCAHRIILTQKTRAAGLTTRDVLSQLLGSTKTQYSVNMKG